MNILLIVVLAILILCTVCGYHKGLFRTVLSAGAIVIALLLTVCTYHYVSKALQRYTKIDDKMEATIVRKMDLNIHNQGKVSKVEQMDAIDKYPLPQTLKMALIDNNNTDVYEAFDVTGFEEYVAHYLSCIIMNAIAFIATQILFMIIIRFVLCMLDIITEIPIIHGIDRTGGLLLGFAEAVLIVWLLLVLVTVFSGTRIGEIVYAQIEQSSVLSFIYDHNYLMHFVTNMTKIIF